MDITLEKYRFGITLELTPGSYGFGTDTTPPIYVYTVCKFVKTYLENDGITLIHITKNLYVCEGISDLENIRLRIETYYGLTDNQCNEL
jgi:hypothetical protein